MVSERWSSQTGFLLATVGAAVGLGNIWRFSAVVGQNGGGAYLLPYLVAAVTCAIPLLVMELAVGRTLRTDVMSAFRSVGPTYAAAGWFVAGGVLIVLSYYLVLTGWVLGFLVAWLEGTRTSFAAFTDSWLPVGYFVVVTVLTGGVVSLGVRGGIERLAKVVVPTVFVVLVGLAIYSATLPGWDEAVTFLFTPQFPVLDTAGVWSAAFGQVFVSLSVGQGIVLTYGRYLDEETNLIRSAVLITVADVGAAIVAGLVVFPIVFGYGLLPTLGTELAFTTLPAAFGTMRFGRVVAVGFFGLLFLVAVSSAVALLEVGVAAATGTTNLGRTQVTGVLTGGVFLLGLPSALSYSPVRLAVAGRPVLDFVDESVGTFALPISAILVALVFAWVADFDRVRNDLGILYPFVRYLVPPVLVVVTVAKVTGLAQPGWRLLAGRASEGELGFVVALATFIALAAFGWVVRDRVPDPRPSRRGNRR